jgi:hypothetical protein
LQCQAIIYYSEHSKTESGVEIPDLRDFGLRVILFNTEKPLRKSRALGNVDKNTLPEGQRSGIVCHADLQRQYRVAKCMLGSIM